VNVSSLIASFATATSYTVTRTARGSVARGKTSAGTTSSVTIVGSIWPASGNDMQRLPENRRATSALNLVTTTELYVGGQGEAYEADKVTVDGETYEVTDVDNWTDSLSRSIGYKCLLTVVR
jgi:hypothetical protein